MRRALHRLLGLLAGLFVSFSLQAGSVVDTVHNLSATGTGQVRAATEEEVCIFCHTSHSSTTVTQLWNRGVPAAVYQPYTSSTAVAQPGQPTGDSLLCLSCHDGTIAIGDVLSRATDITMAGGVTTMPAGDGLIGTDLTHDHPVSFNYTGTLATQNGEIVDPATLPPTVPLDAAGQMQCTSCHDAHSNDFGAFLVMPNLGSQLCTTCHDKTGWSQTSHNLSSASWNNLGADPWPDSTLTTVSDNACGNCHQPHLTTGGPRLLNDAVEEANCSACHNGNVAAENVMGDFNKQSAHRIGDTTGVHDPAEDAVVSSRHVECADCHNPHATQAGANPGDTPSNVRGVNLANVEVDPATRTYEICLRCHGDSPNKPAALTPRQHDQTNIRLEIQTSNPSFHPIAGPGRNANVPSLVAPLTESSIIGCTDCHNSNSAASGGGSGPEGPHGSTFDPILIDNYVTLDNTQESAGNYALCYNCHSRTSILNDASFREHDKHIRGEDTPCNVCHDPHGVSGTQGNSTNNSNLINFDTSVVSPRGNGDLRFVDNGNFTGTCYLVCHGFDHNNESY
jgi:predicted CXXCH cytochrome family protein